MNKTMITLTSLALATYMQAVSPKVYAVVNGDTITAQSIAVALKNPKIQFDTLPKTTQTSILEKLVEQKLLSQYAVKSDVIKSELYKTTLKGLKQDLALQVWMQEESRNIQITQDEVKEYYERSKFKFKARHILVDDKEHAQKIINDLKKAKDIKKEFIALAKSKSKGPSGVNGGDLGEFSFNSMVVPFSEATSQLKIGEFTKTPVKTKFGYHIIFLEDKKSVSVMDFGKAQAQIQQQVGQKKLIEHIQNISNKLKTKAKIEYK